MDAQPIALVLLFVSSVFSGNVQTWPLSEWSIPLFMLGLHWWGMLVNACARFIMSLFWVQSLRVLGLFIAFAIFFLSHPAIQGNGWGLVFGAALLTWFWQRGRDRIGLHMSDERLIRSFQIGIAIVLIVLLFAFLGLLSDEYSNHSDLLNALARTLSLFFASGLIALSLTRLALLRRENARYAAGTRFDPTRPWLALLTIFWVAVVLAAILLETSFYPILLLIFIPLWNLLGYIVVALLFLLFFLLSPIFALLDGLFVLSPRPGLPPRLPAGSSSGTPTAPPLPPFVVLIGQIALVALILLVFFLIIRMVLRQWRTQDSDEDDEEVRERLPVRTILQERRQERERRRQSNKTVVLEELEPDSARARYRDFLQELSWGDDTLARRPAETPVEYQARLQHLIHISPREGGHFSFDTTQLEELTSTYRQERYGHKRVMPMQVRPWASRLAQRLRGVR
jgi:Domain of unknown function (DUF4129)